MRMVRESILSVMLLCAAATPWSEAAETRAESLASATSAPPPAASVGAVQGVITFRGAVPKSSVADDTGVLRPLLHVDRDSGGLQNVAVSVVSGETVAENHKASLKLAPAVMDQHDHEFVPRVLAIRSGQMVKFTNSDTANHNVRTSSGQRENEFNVYTGIDGSYRHRFVPEPRQRPLRVGCDIHPWMRGWIYVFEHSFFSVTDAKGRFRIDSVSPGVHKVRIEQPDIRYTVQREVEVFPGAAAWLDISIEMNAQASDGETSSGSK
jgi:plastocyanin